MLFLQRKIGRLEHQEFVLSAVKLFQVEIAVVLFAEKELQDKSAPATAFLKENAAAGKVHPYSFSHIREGAAQAVLSLM